MKEVVNADNSPFFWRITALSLSLSLFAFFLKARKTMYFIKHYIVSLPFKKRAEALRNKASFYWSIPATLGGGSHARRDVPLGGDS